MEIGLKRLVQLAILLLCAVPAFGQQTPVTATVVDPKGQPYTFSSGYASIACPGNQQPTFNGSPLTRTITITGFDGFGKFSMVLWDVNAIQPINCGWKFMITWKDNLTSFTTGIIGASAQVPAITGSTVVDLSAAISAYAPPLPLSPAAGGGTPGGIPIETQVNFAGTFGGTPCESFANITTGPENVDCDWHSKGPNPNIDVTRYGARFCNSATTPCAAGLTATITSGSPNATISSASTFINGDGVTIYGAGPAITMSTPNAPTVVQALALTGTSTGLLTLNAPTGSTTYCYKIVARDVGGGLTAASSETCTATGVATLGMNTVNITSSSRAGDVVTVTTATSHGFKIGCGQGGPSTRCGEVFIGSGGSDVSFRGWFPVASAANGTTFTYNTYADTRNGATTSSTGGTATWYACNHVTWTQVVGASQYYVYGGASGAETLIGASMLEGLNTDFTFDDFGTTIMGGFTLPPYVPNTPPVAAKADNLTTTILSGAGTTSLVLAANASTSVAGATVRLDSAPALLLAAQAADALNGSGTVMLPVGPANTQIVVNSYLDTHALRFAVQISGQLLLNETWQIGPRGSSDAVRWEGITPQNGPPPANAWQPDPIVFVNTANPGLYVDSGNDVTINGTDFRCTGSGGNSCRIALVEGGFNQTYKDDSFTSGSGAGDINGIDLYLRGQAGVGSAGNIIIDRVTFAGGASADGVSHTPLFYCNDCGDLQVRSAYYLHRGALINGDPSGFTTTDIQHSYINGGFQPLYTRTGGNNSDAWFIGSIVMDTIPHPCVALFSLVSLASKGNGGTTGRVCAPFGGLPPFSGVRSTQYFSGTIGDGSRDNFNFISQSSGAFDGVFGTNDGIYSVLGVNGAIASGVSYPIFINGAPPAAPTCGVSAGGSLPIQSYTFQVVPIWQTGGEGTYSANSSTCTTTTGNQTITINWTIPPGSPTGMRLYYSGLEDSHFTDPFPVSVTSFIWTTSTGSAGAVKVSNGILPTAGPTMLMPGLQGIVSGGPVIPAGITVAQLPTAAPGNAGQIRVVTDSTAVAAEGQTCVGASTNTALAFSNGTVWKCF
jgi:hypothetical protein